MKKNFALTTSVYSRVNSCLHSVSRTNTNVSIDVAIENEFVFTKPCIFRTVMYTRNYGLSRAVWSSVSLCYRPLKAPHRMEAFLRRFVSVRNAFAAYFIQPFIKVAMLFFLRNCVTDIPVFCDVMKLHINLHVKLNLVTLTFSFL